MGDERQIDDDKLRTQVFTLEYGIAVRNERLQNSVPFISDTGVDAPEAPIFTILFNLGAILVAITVCIRHMIFHVRYNTNGMSKVSTTTKHMNQLSKVCGGLTVVGLTIIDIDCGIKVIADDKFLDDCLFAHNKYRDLHENTSRLKANRTATEYALSRIRSLAKIDGQRPVDNQRVVFGENFYWYYDNTGYHSCADAVDLWYKGRDRYDYNRPAFHEKTGGFSQVVWRGSQYLGCARVEDDTRKYFETYIVCNYLPAGNVDGQYPYNVYPLREVDRPSVAPVIGGGSWSGSADRPVSVGHRPEASGHKPEADRPYDRPNTVHRPINGVNNDGWAADRPVRPVDRPISSNGWPSDRPSTGSGGVWTVERPERPSARPPPPTPPGYPLIFYYY
ncbi:unnamed protein product [Medioppia subpectinata]|uniref:SCP domain-containing protein n=1 Tax=Medioppia subpectinata TaxID=1979941 RepID=A0A7R9KFQ0_9ACAR|nr:unnamed protein product [Medioppia subpectinata]CAG2102363.1 unnamed protein product [Medioppia subpectinata]